MKTPLLEPWMEDLPTLRRCVVASSAMFPDLRTLIPELLSVWESVHEFVRYTEHRHVKSTSDKVIIACVVHVVVSISSFILADLEV